MKWNGPDALRPLLVPVEELRTHPDNPRRGDVELIARSLEQFGQTKPIIVYDYDSDHADQPWIFAGNHTYRAATEILGWTHIAATKPSYLTPEEADRYLLMDNRSADRATYDQPELAAILTELADTGRLDRAGFTPEDLAELQREARELADATLAEFEAGRDEGLRQDEPEPALGPAGPMLRQVLLVFRPPETFDPFAKRLLALRKLYGTDDYSSTVAEAVRRQFKRVWGTEPAPAVEELPE